MSEHDQRPREALEREQKEKKRKEMEEKRMIDQFLGKKEQSHDWIRFFKLADREHNFVDHKRPALFPKGPYEPPSNVLNNLLRGEAEFTENFKLYARPLKPSDRCEFG